MRSSILVAGENSAAHKVFSDTIDTETFDVYYYPSWPTKTKKNVQLSKKQNIRRSIREFLLNTYPGILLYHVFLKYIAALAHVIKIKKEIRKINLKYNPINIQGVVLSTDRGPGSELALSLWARQNRIKRVVLEYAYFASYEQASKSRKLKIFKTFSSLSRASRDGTMFYMPHVEIALKILQAFPQDPWTVGQGNSDLLVVSSQLVKKRLIKEGAAGSKILVCGSVEFDEVIGATKENFEPATESLNRCIVSVPQWWEHNLLSRDAHFDYLNKMFAVLSDKFEVVYASLHPKMDKALYRYLEDQFNVVILSKPLKSSLHLAEIFISTFSSTLIWAAMTNKKIIVVDFAGLNYSDFFNEFSFELVNSIGQLEDCLSEKVYLKNNNSLLYDSGLGARKRINEVLKEYFS